MSDRSQYWHDYYQKHKDRIRERKRGYSRNEEQRLRNNLVSREWRAKNRHAMKIARSLEITVAEARKVLEAENDRTSRPSQTN